MEEKRRQYSVVVIEDEPLLLKYIVKRVEQASCHFRVCGTALDGEKGLEVIEEQLPDVVISDIKMPQMDGLELARRMRDRFPQTILLLLTGYADFQYAQTAIRYGVFDYLLKPLASDELKERLDRVALYLERLHPFDELRGLTGASAQQVFEMIRNHLQNQYAGKIDLQSLSEAFGYSPAYITKLFRKYADATPLRFLTDIRIHAAAQLLKSTDLPVAEVGSQVGYPDPFYFSRVFKRYKGVNPQAYRGQEP